MPRCESPPRAPLLRQLRAESAGPAPAARATLALRVLLLVVVLLLRVVLLLALATRASPMAAASRTQV